MSEEIKQTLKSIYDENIQWLTFAELKNGALLTIMVAIIGIISQIDMSLWVKSFFMVYSIVIILICIFSFIPFLNQKELVKKCAKCWYKKTYKGSFASNNIVFYAEIFTDGKENYKRAVKKILNLNASYSFSAIEKNYIEQIIQISTISSIKYYIFKMASIFFCIMSLCTIIAVIIA